MRILSAIMTAVSMGLQAADIVSYLAQQGFGAQEIQSGMQAAGIGAAGPGQAPAGPGMGGPPAAGPPNAFPAGPGMGGPPSSPPSSGLPVGGPLQPNSGGAASPLPAPSGPGAPLPPGMGMGGPTPPGPAGPGQAPAGPGMGGPPPVGVNQPPSSFPAGPGVGGPPPPPPAPSGLPSGSVLPSPQGPAYPGSPLPTAPAPPAGGASSLPQPSVPRGTVLPPAAGAAASALPAAEQSPAMVERIMAAIKGNPKAALAVAGILGIGAAGVAIHEYNKPDPAAAAAPAAAPATPEKTPQQLQDDANAKRTTDDAAALVEQQAQNQQAQAAYARAQKAKLEDEMAKANMTDEQKEAARRALETDLANINNAGANSRTAATEAGANSRTAAQEAGATARTGITEAGANTRSAAEIAGRHADVGTTEAGATARNAATNDVTMRGQDQQARDAQDNFVHQMLANGIAQGTLSLAKATQMSKDYIAQRKLPSEVLQNVSQAVAPFLPFMTARKDGEAAPGFEAGGPMSQLVKSGGGKYNAASYASHPIHINLGAIAQQYGAGDPNTPPPPMPSVDQIYSGVNVGAPLSTDPAAIRAQSASAQPLPRPASAGPAPVPAAPQGQPQTPVDGLMPTTMVAPMSPDQEQQILASLQ